MDPAIRIGRHSDLWLAGCTRVERTVIAGLIFASVIFFNVIEPYAGTEQSRANLLIIEAQQVEAETELARLEAVAASLEAISGVVEAAAWGRHQEELAQRFRSGAVTAPQQEADQTIQKIAAEVRSEVLDPLAAVVATPGLSAPLADHPARMQAVIERWEQSYLGQRWYQTVREKERTVVELDATIGSLQQEARQLLEELQHSVDAERARSQRAQADLVAKIETMREAIGRSLDESIPAWAKGLVSVERMVSIYPWILVGIAIYLVGCALVSERHFHGMASAAGWSQLERSDPLLSSVWTLTWRGAASTALTLCSYLAVLAGLAYFLNRSIALGGAGHPPGWSLNLIFLLALLIVIAMPFSRRSGAVDSSPV